MHNTCDEKEIVPVVHSVYALINKGLLNAARCYFNVSHHVILDCVYVYVCVFVFSVVCQHIMADMDS